MSYRLQTLRSGYLHVLKKRQTAHGVFRPVFLKQINKPNVFKCYQLRFEKVELKILGCPSKSRVYWIKNPAHNAWYINKNPF